MRSSWFGAALPWLALGCTEPAEPANTGKAVIVLELARGSAVARIDADAFYRRQDAQRISLLRSSTSLTPATTQLSLEVELTRCLADPARIGGGEGCLLEIELKLLDKGGALLDSVIVGPVDAAPHQTVSAPAVTVVCSGVARSIRQGATSASETWTPGAGMYYLPGPLVFSGSALLTIQPGTRVCAAPTASIAFRQQARLNAVGNATAPILFTASDTSRGWVGLDFEFGVMGGPSSIQYAVIEHSGLGATGIPVGLDTSTVGHIVDWDHVRFRQARGTALALWPGATVENSVIDTTRAGRAAVVLGPHGQISTTVIRRAFSRGVVTVGNDGVISNVAIDATAGTGLEMLYTLGSTSISGGNVTITRSQGYPAIITLPGLAALAPDSISQRAWLGNDRDTVVIAGAANLQIGYAPLKRGTVTAFGILPWRVQTLGFTVDTLGVMVFRPGAFIALDEGIALAIISGGRLTSRGAPGRPVTITAIDPSRRWDIIYFANAAADTSYLTNTRIEYAGRGNIWAVWIDGPHNVVLDSVHIRQVAKGAILIQGPSHSRVSRTLVDTAGTTVFGDGAIRINADQRLEDVVVHGARGDGVLLAGDGLQLNGLEVTGSGGNGIVVLNSLTNFTFNRVNVFGNALSGISNQTVGPLTLPNVWWGDAAGPNGPNGDGVGGLITFAPWATAPYAVAAPVPVSRASSAQTSHLKGASVATVKNLRAKPN